MIKYLNPRLLTILVMITIAILVIVFLTWRPLKVDVAQRENNIPIQVFGLGTVEAKILSEIGFEVGAKLMQLSADQGEFVKKGDILARLNNIEQQARLSKARAGVDHSQANMNMADVATEKARAVLAQKQQVNRRKQALLKQQTISIEAAEESQLEVDVAKAELAVSISDVAVARAALEDARAQFEFDQVLLDQHVLKAPYDAVIVKRHVELGAVLNAGKALFTLVAPDTVWVLAYIDEVRSGQIRLGQSAEVHLRSLPRQVFKGRVSRIDIESDRVTEERRVYITCENCPETFHLGEQAEVIITTSVLEQALMVPEKAILDFNGKQGMVWTVEDGILHLRPVKFGHRSLNAMHEITDGLPQNAHVVINLTAGLKEGRSVKVTQTSKVIQPSGKKDERQ